MDFLKYIYFQFVNFLFPRYCLLCNEPGANVCDRCSNYRFSFRGLQSCPKCYGSLQTGRYIHKICRRHSALNGVFVVLNYEKNLKQVLSSLKYHFYSDIAADLGKLMQQKFNSLAIKTDYLVPVPLYKTRYNWRGFNQSTELAKHLTIPIREYLIRSHETKSQAGLSRSSRLQNLSHAFKVTNKFNPRGKDLFLIDDVLTTSATLEACAQPLKAKGARTVFALVLAKDNRDFGRYRLE